MSDFLSNLAARSFGRVELVRPRLASLFEPPRAAGGSTLRQSLGPDALEVAEISDETRTEAAPPARQPASRVRETQSTAADLKLSVAESDPGRADLPAKPNSRQRQPTRQRSSSLAPAAIPSSAMKPELLPGFVTPKAVPPHVSRLVVPASAAKSSAVPPAALIATQSVEAQPGSRPLDASLTPRRSEKAVSVPASPSLPALQAEPPAGKPQEQSALERLSRVPIAAQDQTERELLRSDAGQQRQSAFQAPSRRPSNQDISTSEEQRPAAPGRSELLPSQTPRSARPAMVVVQPQVTRYLRQTTPAPAEAAARPEPTSTIQVTIGRIEVRATPPPAKPPSEKRSAPPVMSLDEYLRRRAKAGGR